MDEFIEKLMDTYIIWHKQVGPYINKGLHFMFRGAMHAIGARVEENKRKHKRKYDGCTTMLKNLKNCFNPNSYENETWADAAGEVLSGLNELEVLASP